MKSLIITVIVAFLFTSCNNSKRDSYISKTEVTNPTQMHPGKKLMETNCYVCHSPIASQNDRLGPPMVAIKKHYINDSTTKEEFINAIQKWVKNPTEENAKMFGAVRRFGVMPKTPFPEETVKIIADYMFDNDIDQPEWFEDHFNQERGKRMGNGMMNGKGKGMQKQ